MYATSIDLQLVHYEGMMGQNIVFTILVDKKDIQESRRKDIKGISTRDNLMEWQGSTINENSFVDFLGLGSGFSSQIVKIVHRTRFTRYNISLADYSEIIFSESLVNVERILKLYPNIWRKIGF